MGRTFLINAVAMLIAAYLLASASVCSAGAVTAYLVSADSDIIGALRHHTAAFEDTLLDLARDNDLGYNEIVSANPGLDPWIPGEGASVVIPTVWLLPEAPRTGIVLNLAEMRLYRYFREGGLLIAETYPVGVGSEGNDTPEGVYEITEKEQNPTWTPPEAIRQENPELPDVVPPGPDNPLGAYKMRLGYTTYLIHGTNRPWGIGRRVSHGCIRFYPEDIEKLFGRVNIGDKVRVVFQPVKIGLAGDRIFVEFHEDYNGGTDLFSYSVSELLRRGLMGRVDVYSLFDAAAAMSGIPVDVTATVDDKPAKQDN